MCALNMMIHGMFQSTHPHGVRLRNCRQLLNITNVSIHAPTWGATYRSNALSRCIEVSIHAPTWGATKGLEKVVDVIESFNPRTHMGCDMLARKAAEKKEVSIHAPTWGATVAKSYYEGSIPSFNSRTHMGCDD